jgi:hypothetical protein
MFQIGPMLHFLWEQVETRRQTFFLSHASRMSINCLNLTGAIAAVGLKQRQAGRAAFIVGAVLMSHWHLDLLVHQKDLPKDLHLDRTTYDKSLKLGMGLWRCLCQSPYRKHKYLKLKQHAFCNIVAGTLG